MAECIKSICNLVDHQLELISIIIGALVDVDKYPVPKPTTKLDDSVSWVLRVLLQGAGASCKTVLYLSDEPGLRTRDCYPIARSICESLVNACYILAEGEESAKAAIKHARQKSFRDLDRNSTIGSSRIQVQFQGSPEKGDKDDIEKEMAEYETRRGRERGWTKLSIDNRIRVVAEKFGHSVLLALHFIRFNVYRHSSEIIHGTLFGAMHFFGMTTPRKGPVTREEVGENIGGQHMLLLSSLLIGLSGFIEAFHKACGYEEIFHRSKGFKEELRKIPYLAKDRGTPDS